MDTKPWWQSKTIIGGIGTFLAGAAMVLKFFFHVDIADQIPILSAGAAGILAMVGSVVVIWGRCTATKDIAGTFPKATLPVIAIVGCIFFCDACAQRPVIVEGSAAATVGQDLVVAAARATEAFAKYENDGVDYAWAVAFALNAYRDIIKTSADVKALVKVWTDGKGQKFADRLANLFDAASGTPAEKTAALAAATQIGTTNVAAGNP